MMKLPLKKIRCDGGTQPRMKIDETVIAEYVEAMRAGDVFPPVDVFYDGSEYWLADGFHRIGSAMVLQLPSFECNVHQGTLHDAQWYSCGVNKAHGLRRTNEDKVRSVKNGLRLNAWRSDTEIAKHVAVGRTMVAKYRQELVDSGEIAADAPCSSESASCRGDMMQPPAAEPGQPTRIVTRRGRTYQMRVGKIGLAPKPGRAPAASKAALPADPAAAARAMLSSYERSFLNALVEELADLLAEASRQ
jgi:hypothetical protein